MALAAGQTGHLTDHQEGVYQVDHGATAGTARPTLGSSSTSPNVVLWNGSVEPTNASNGDWWFDSANSLVKVKEGGSFVASGNGTYATSDALDLTKKRLASTRPRVVSLMAGQVDESPTAASCTVGADTTNYKIGTRAHKMTIGSATTARIWLDPPGAEDPITHDPAATIGLWVYLPDASKVDHVEVRLYTSSDLSQFWARNNTQSGVGVSLVNGWNLVRFPAHVVQPLPAGWGNIYRTRIEVSTNAATEATIGHVWLECPLKAQIVVVNDWGTQSFKENAYPALKERGIPVVWAVRPSLLGTGTGPDAHLTEAEVEELAAENGNSISFHSWAGNATSAMTSDELITDVMRCQKWLGSRGYSGGIFRPAWVQNLATNHAAVQGLVFGYGSPVDSYGLQHWPPTDRWNITRINIHGLPSGDLDTHFDNLAATHCLGVFYTHGVDASGGNHATPAEWSAWLAKVDEMLATDTVEGVTYEDLFARGGGRFRQGFGDYIAEYAAADGSIETRRIP